jgi:hypothetical protein
MMTNVDTYSWKLGDLVIAEGVVNIPDLDDLEAVFKE